MEKPNVSQRAIDVLRVLIDQYIENGQPVASKALASNDAIGLSAASVRNIMADLEAKGFLVSPHTSAGRVPTQQAYRLFVNNLLSANNMHRIDVNDYMSELSPTKSASDLVASASSLLSEVSRYAGVVAIPKTNQVSLRHIDLVNLSGNRVLVILVLNDGDVQNRIIFTDKVFKDGELTQVANYINHEFAGSDLAGVRAKLLKAMKDDKQRLGDLMQQGLDVAQQAMSEDVANKQEDYVVAGQSNLLDSTNFGGIDELRTLFEAFSEKQTILHVLDKVISADGVQIYIGEESGHEAFQHCSIIAAPYKSGEQVLGMLGVVGPTRMTYRDVIPLVNVTSKLLSTALNQKD